MRPRGIAMSTRLKGEEEGGGGRENMGTKGKEKEVEEKEGGRKGVRRRDSSYRH